MAGTPYFCVYMRLEIQLSRQKAHTATDVRKEKEFLLPLPPNDTRFLLLTLSYANERVAVQIISLNGTFLY